MLGGSSHLPASSAGHVNACLFGVAPGGGCLAVRLTADAVRSYRTVSPLPDPHDSPRRTSPRRPVSALTRAALSRKQAFPPTYPIFSRLCRLAAAKSGAQAIGGLISVALFLALRRAGVTRHPTLWSPDFPLRTARTIVSVRFFRTQRLPGRLPARFYSFDDPLSPRVAAGKQVSTDGCARLTVQAIRQAMVAPARKGTRVSSGPNAISLGTGHGSSVSVMVLVLTSSP